MKVLKIFGIIFFCGLLSPSQEVLSGLSCAVSPRAMQNGNYKNHLQVVFALKALWGIKLPEFYSPSSLFHNSSGLQTLLRAPESHHQIHGSGKSLLQNWGMFQLQAATQNFRARSGLFPLFFSVSHFHIGAADI